MPKILVVEDDQRISSLVRHILEADGYVAVTVGDAEGAWRELVAEVPDAAVVDLRLPGADGWAFLERVRGDGRFSRLPVVILTGLQDAETIAKAGNYGALYLGKPFSGDALLDKIRKAMEGSGHEGLAPIKQRVDLRGESVVMLLGEYRVHGRVHLPSELERFSDAWESVIRDSRQYVPLTDARVETHAGATITTSAFLQVRKEQIRAVFPVDATETNATTPGAGPAQGFPGAAAPPSAPPPSSGSPGWPTPPGRPL